MQFNSKREIAAEAANNGLLLNASEISKSGNLFFIHVDGITSKKVVVCTGDREYFGPGAERAYALFNIFKQSNVKV